MAGRFVCIELKKKTHGKKQLWVNLGHCFYIFLEELRRNHEVQVVTVIVIIRGHAVAQLVCECIIF